MRHRSIKSRAGKVMLGAVLAGALSGAGASIARAQLTLDLEPDINGTQYTPNNPDTSVTVTPGTTSLSVEVYGVVVGGAGSTNATDGLGGAFASFDAAGSLATGLSLALNSSFDYDPGSAASNGSSYTVTDTNGVAHVGVGPTPTFAASSSTPNYTSQSTSPTNWAFAAYLNNTGTTVASILTGGTTLTTGPNANNGAFYDLGTLTLNLNGSAANGTSTTLQAFGRTQQTGSTMVAALWTENNVVTTPAAGSAIQSDESGGLTVTVGSTVVHNPGDVNGDGIVDQNDLNIVIENFNKPGQTYAEGNLVGDSTVDQNDLNQVIEYFNYKYSDYMGTGIVLAPEPMTIGLIPGMMLLTGLRRRRK